jgi:hypothetical protein
MDKLDLYNVRIPASTDSYSAVSHQNIIEAVYEQLDKRNLQVVNEKYNVAANGDKVIGYFDMNYMGNSEMGMRLAFRNSYDKSMSVAFVAGTQVFICSNGCISGEIQFLRKHTGSVLTELNNKIVTTIEQLEGHFLRTERHSIQMKSIELPKIKAAELYGRMFMVEDIISPTQLSIVKKELNEPTHKVFEEETLWSAYNHVTFALKEAHPLNYINQHVNLHKFVEAEYQLV